MSTGFAISEYHDAQEVIAELEALISQPIRTLKPEALKEYLHYFETKCKTSQAMIKEAQKVIKGGVQHNLAFNYPFPLAFDRAEGAKLVDVDGNEYIDFLQAGGPTVLESNPPAIREKIIELLNTTGPVTGLFHEYEMKLAQLIVKHYPGVDKFRMLGSGTEACMASIRVARLATKKKKVIKMGGAYHGWSDQLSYGNRIPGVGGLESHGIPSSAYKHTQEVFPGDIKALERKLRRNQLRGGTACVILEPIGPESGTRPLPKEYPAQVRALCDKYGALLIFDEVVTGFRLGLSGAQGYFGVTPDLTVFGKVVAGGYPSAGGLGGKDQYIEFLSGGVGGKKGKKAHVGGTMAANPLSSAAGYYTILEMERTGAAEIAGKAGDRLTKGLQKLIKQYNLPFVAYNQGSICHLETVGTMLFDISFKKFWQIPKKLKEIHARKDVMTHMGAAYMAEGIVTLAGSRMYTSAACTNEIIDEALVRFERVFKNIEGV